LYKAVHYILTLHASQLQKCLRGTIFGNTLAVFNEIAKEHVSLCVHRSRRLSPVRLIISVNSRSLFVLSQHRDMQKSSIFVFGFCFPLL